MGCVSGHRKLHVPLMIKISSIGEVDEIKGKEAVLYPELQAQGRGQSSADLPGAQRVHRV